MVILITVHRQFTAITNFRDIEWLKMVKARKSQYKVALFIFLKNLPNSLIL